MRKALWSTLPVLVAIVGCNGSSDSAPSPNPAKPVGSSGGTAPPVSTENITKLQIKDSAPGSGPAAVLGDTVWVTYVGKLTNGTIFDSSERNGGNPFKVTLGTGEVIKGWEDGLVGAKTGTKRELKIPYALAYGENGRNPTIPPRADLVFDIEVLAVMKQADEGTVDVTDIKKGSGPVVKDGSTITINYTGTLVNGTEFDSTKKQGKPFTFKVGEGETLKGIDAGVVGMMKGGKRKLFIPPKLGLPYGSEAIPAGTPLIVEVEVLSVK